jgi:hypothetical protein
VILTAACEIHNHPAPPSNGEPPVVVVPPVVLPPFPLPPEPEPPQQMAVPRLNQTWVDFVRTGDGVADALRIWTMTFGPGFPQSPDRVNMNDGTIQFTVTVHDSDRPYRIESRIWPVADPFTVTHLQPPNDSGTVEIPRSLMTQTMRVAVEVRDPDTNELFDQFRFTFEALP